jgi:hypothetical protein
VESDLIPKRDASERAGYPREERPAFVLVTGRLVGLGGLEPPPSSLSGIDGQALCCSVLSQVVPIRECYRDGVNHGLLLRCPIGAEPVYAGPSACQHAPGPADSACAGGKLQTTSSMASRPPQAGRLDLVRNAVKARRAPVLSRVMPDSEHGWAPASGIQRTSPRFYGSSSGAGKQS